MTEKMNTPEQKDNIPRWLKLSLSISSAILVFRLARFSIGLLFSEMGRFPVPLCVINFLHNWDFLVVPALSIAAAVLISRWQEHFLSGRSRKTGIAILVLVSAMAFSPVRLHYYVQYQMSSPLDIAIREKYPVQTIGMIADRYPHLVNDGNPLASAAYQGRTNVVELLIKKGANVDKAVECLQQLDAIEPLELLMRQSEIHNK